MINKSKIILSGDFAPIEYKGVEKIILSHELVEIFEGAEIQLTNLECPLTGKTNKILKSGPHIRSVSRNIYKVKNTNAKIVCLANNHIFDYGEEGIRETISVCESNGIDTVGIVNRTDNIPAYLIKEINNKKVGLLNYCEHEFSVRKNGEMGANGYDNIKAFYEVNELKRKCEYVIIIYHGGVEYYPLPRPGIKKIFRYLIDIGADAVISHHTHTISGYEVYKNKPIIYGLGNFYFPYENEPEEWYTGLICELRLDSEISFNLHPVRQSKDFREIKLLMGKEKKEIDEKILNLNAIIADDNILMAEWKKYIRKVRTGYLKQILNLKKYEKVLLKFGLFENNILYTKRNITVNNLISCESHRDILLEILKNEK